MPNKFRYLRACAWGGPVVLVIFIVFWGILARNIPPYSAALTADEFASQFRADAYQIRIGLVVQMVFTTLYFIWGMAITKVMEEAERDNNILSTLQLWGAGFTTIVVMVPCSMWIAATFREDAPPIVIQLLFDAGWMFFDLAWSLTTLQMAAFGICFLTDRRPQPLIPRWVSWLSIWVGTSFVLLCLMPFFKDGPFSRSGTINYYVEFGAFFLFMAVVSYYLLVAIKRLEAEGQGSAEVR